MFPSLRFRGGGAIACREIPPAKVRSTTTRPALDGPKQLTFERPVDLRSNRARGEPTTPTDKPRAIARPLLAHAASPLAVSRHFFVFVQVWLRFGFYA